MQTRERPGRWTSLLGGERSFAEEAESAKIIASKARLHDGQLDIELGDPLPGWVVPLWSVDRDWLYLRRPEGVWKTRLPRHKPGHPVVLWARRSDQDPTRGTFIGDDLRPRTGWAYRAGVPMTPADMDARKAANPASNCPAGEIGTTLTREVDRSGSRVVYSVGEEFGEPPILVEAGDWILGADRAGARSVAFRIKGADNALIALRHEELWLRFSGDLLAPFDARVTASQAC